MTDTLRSAADPGLARHVASGREGRRSDLAVLHREMFKAPRRDREGMELVGITGQAVTRRWARVTVAVSTAGLDEAAAAEE